MEGEKMARGRKTSPAEDLVALVSLLPWWAGVLLAIGSYVVLHRWAGQPLPAAAQPAQIGTVVTQTIWRTLASIGQYVFPLVFIVGAGVSAWRRKQRQQLVISVAQSGAANALDGMSWQQFEKLVGEGFRLGGYRVSETGGGGADGGVDLVLTKASEKFLVQCKQWRALKVGVSVVRELYGVMAARGASGGFVVTSGRFTDEATAFANGRNIWLIDGPELLALIHTARTEGSRAAPASSATLELTCPPSELAASPPQVVPACPLCAKSMVRRVAKRGSNAGVEFWGCSGYPSCRGTRATE
jgi:restriction system protein